jgi:hypothetical protein
VNIATLMSAELLQQIRILHKQPSNSNSNNPSQGEQRLGCEQQVQVQVQPLVLVPAQENTLLRPVACLERRHDTCDFVGGNGWYTLRRVATSSDPQSSLLAPKDSTVRVV